MRIKILGAGLSGLTAAINLAKAGYSVDVYEKHSEVGQQVKQNAQMLPNWIFQDNILTELEKCNIKINPVNEIKSVEIYLSNQKIIVHGNTPIGYTVLRGGENSFEKYLAQQTKKLDINIHTRCKKSIDGNIIATGPKGADALIFGGVFEGKFNPNTVKVFFNSGYTPKAYFYLYPHNKKQASFIVTGIRRFKINPKKSFEKLITKTYLLPEIKKSNLLYTFGAYANFRIPKTAMLGKSLLVGEVAGFQDRFLGFGMSYAIKSGYLAAKSIIEGKNYDVLWKKTFLSELRRSNKLRDFFEVMNENDIKRLFQRFVKNKFLYDEHKTEIDIEIIKNLLFSKKIID